MTTTTRTTRTKPSALYARIVNSGYRSRRAFARAIGIQQQTIQLMQRGYMPGPELLSKIANALHLSTDELVKLTRST